MFGLFTRQQDFAMLWMTREFGAWRDIRVFWMGFSWCFVFVVSFFLDMYFL